mmetsp:Transcript_1729/g.3825  ORF Transcript_1729/g.3825 Transcript_1729/m.3825 type:complete len:283 (-) Transcript_1729:128-976(-)
MLQQCLGQFARDFARQGPLAALRAAVGFEEELREEVEVGGVHCDRRINGDALNLAIASCKVGADSDAVDDQTPNHLHDLNDSDHRSDRLHQFCRCGEGHQEEIHVHDRMDEVVGARKPQTWGVLSRESQPTEKHHCGVVVPLQEPDLFVFENEEDSVAQLWDLGKAEETECQNHRSAAGLVNKLGGWSADRVLQPIFEGCSEEAAREVVATPSTENGQTKVPSGEAIVHDFAIGMLSDRVSGGIDHRKVPCTENNGDPPLILAESSHCPESLYIAMVPGQDG